MVEWLSMYDIHKKDKWIKNRVLKTKKRKTMSFYDMNELYVLL